MRRRFARSGGRPLRRMLIRGIPPLLIRSNELVGSGRFAEAADGFETLARAAEAGGGHRAAHFYLEAGRARLMAGQGTEAVMLLRRGFESLAASPLRHRLARPAGRIIAELHDAGLRDEAEQLAVFIRGLGAGPDTLSAGDPALRRPSLPTHCPGCGAPVRPDEVDWLDDATAECEYCGSPVRAE